MGPGVTTSQDLEVCCIGVHRSSALLIVYDTHQRAMREGRWTTSVASALPYCLSTLMVAEAAAVFKTAQFHSLNSGRLGLLISDDIALDSERLGLLISDHISLDSGS